MVLLSLSVFGFFFFFFSGRGNLLVLGKFVVVKVESAFRWTSVQFLSSCFFNSARKDVFQGFRCPSCVLVIPSYGEGVPVLAETKDTCLCTVKGCYSVS